MQPCYLLRRLDAGGALFQLVAVAEGLANLFAQAMVGMRDGLIHDGVDLGGVGHAGLVKGRFIAAYVDHAADSVAGLVKAGEFAF